MKEKGFSQERIDNDYSTDEGTLIDGTTNQVVNFSDIETGYKALISNDGDYSFTIKFNDILNDNFTIKAGEVYKHDLFIFEKLYISNSSGHDIDYRIMVQGL